VPRTTVPGSSTSSYSLPRSPSIPRAALSSSYTPASVARAIPSVARYTGDAPPPPCPQEDRARCIGHCRSGRHRRLRRNAPAGGQGGAEDDTGGHRRGCQVAERSESDGKVMESLQNPTATGVAELHGPVCPRRLGGRAVSHGCLRLATEDIIKLSRPAPAGHSDRDHVVPRAGPSIGDPPPIVAVQRVLHRGRYHGHAAEDRQPLRREPLQLGSDRGGDGARPGD